MLILEGVNIVRHSSVDAEHKIKITNISYKIPGNVTQQLLFASQNGNYTAVRINNIYYLVMFRSSSGDVFATSNIVEEKGDIFTVLSENIIEEETDDRSRKI